MFHGPNPGKPTNFNDNMKMYNWTELSTPGIFPLPIGDFIGQAGMLVKKHVLDDIGYPWFKAGQMDAGKLQEDMTFCAELQRRGHTIWVDRDNLLDHYFTVGVTAKKVDGAYVPGLISDGMTILLPQAKLIQNPRLAKSKEE